MMLYSIAICVVFVVNVCWASPTPQEVPELGSLDSVSVTLGFPAEYLPIAVSTPSTSTNDSDISANLTLPINPRHPDFVVDVTLDDRDTPRGAELVASLTTHLYHSWKDTANLPIESPRVERQQPFNKFRFTITPSSNPRTSLTPLKVGLATCHIIRRVTDHGRWPGHILAKISYTTTLPGIDIGSIKVDNAPLPSLTQSPTTTVTSRTLTIPKPIEQRWLSCFCRTLFFFIQHAATDMVTNDPSMYSKPTWTTYYFSCGGGDRFDLTIYPDANADRQWRLSWDRLVRAMLVWVNSVAVEGDLRYLRPEVVKQGGIKQAVMSIVTGWDGGVAETA